MCGGSEFNPDLAGRLAARQVHVGFVWSFDGSVTFKVTGSFLSFKFRPTYTIEFDRVDG